MEKTNKPYWFKCYICDEEYRFATKKQVYSAQAVIKIGDENKTVCKKCGKMMTSLFDYIDNVTNGGEK